jgi:segregation and condensation protein A
LEDFIAAAEAVLTREVEKKALGTVITAPKVTIRERIILISKKMGDKPHANFLDFLGENPSRIEVVVTFLALLELVKRYRVEAKQSGLFADIEIERMAEWDMDEELDIEFE